MGALEEPTLNAFGLRPPMLAVSSSLGNEKPVNEGKGPLPSNVSRRVHLLV